jgi:hypothetical protein
LCAAALAAGCGDDSAEDLAVVHDLSGNVDMAKPPGDGSNGMVNLKIENYLNWCSVSVDSGAASTMAVITKSVASGTTVHLAGDTASATEFVWGYWRGTAGDTGSAHDTSKMTTVTLTADKTVQACCPLTSAPTTPCPDPT